LASSSWCYQRCELHLKSAVWNSRLFYARFPPALVALVCGCWICRVEGAGTINVRAVPVADSGGHQPQPIERATVLGPVKAKPLGWPRRRGQP
jgi:hypothetical protein